MGKILHNEYHLPSSWFKIARGFSFEVFEDGEYRHSGEDKHEERRCAGSELIVIDSHKMESG